MSVGNIAQRGSYHSLGHHGTGHLHEAGYVGATDIVDSAVLALAIADALGVDAVHDFVQALVHVFCTPYDVGCILAHLQATGSHTTGINCLAGCIKGLEFQEMVDGLGSASHVGDFTHTEHAVIGEVLGILAVEFVLCGTRQCYIHLLFPWTTAGEECGRGGISRHRAGQCRCRWHGGRA